MKRIYKILLVPVVLALMFIVIVGALWCIGKLVVILNVNIFQGSNVYDFDAIVLIGAGSLLIACLAFIVFWLMYEVLNNVLD